MGLAIDRDRFEEREYALFSRRLEESLGALRALLDRPGFGSRPLSLGSELELCLVDARGRPAPINAEVLAESDDPRLTVELDRFNLECNLRHSLLAGRPFAALRRELESALDEVRRAAALHGARPAVIGILPTLTPSDLQSAAMTDSARFRALSAGIQRLRHEPFRVRIDGAEPLRLTCEDVTFEGAATSLQIHLRVRPASFARVYNAIQLASAPVLAVAGNSPTFLGHRLWCETRVALFKQTVDDRDAADRRRHRAARVSFGSDWVEEDAFELFRENVELHEPLLPVLGDEDPLACVRGGGVPKLEEMRLHQGTVWHWNRAIYDPAEDGHLRIEMRALPAGPSVVDMLANVCFFVGLGLGLERNLEAWKQSLSFGQVQRNFYRAAQSGLDAKLLWPPEPGAAPESQPARRVVLSLLEEARCGLEEAQVDAPESEPLLAVVAERARSGWTGAAWQLAALSSLERELPRSEALAAMLERYLAHAEEGAPVHAWPREA